MKKSKLLKRILLGILAALVVLIVVFVAVYFTRLQSIFSIRKMTDYPDGFNVYSMDINYPYNLDRIIEKGVKDNQTMSDAVLAEAIPYLPVHIEPQDYSCSVFSITDTEGKVLMGRNYDFDVDTSALVVNCAPAGGYRSVATAALDHVGASAMAGPVDRVASLAAPFICLDGMNEKGVAVAILMLDSETVIQDTAKPDIFTTLAVRLILDRTATTQEAVDLLKSYDMFAVAGGDYHFYISDASGDGRIVEYDCHSETREIVDTPVRTATNFYEIYKDKVLPNQYNGIYGHGRERYDRVEALFDAHGGQFTHALAWQALQEAQQLPKEGEQTSNTQWSIVFNLTDLTSEFVLRRNWEDIVPFTLKK